ncbi:MFS general substrate transporter [Mycena floridula]|nr:MFS general substrate transporter [Mycena floridula]
MGFGILEDKHLAQVPGTALLSDLRNGPKVILDELTSKSLKHKTGKDSHIILIPQPSDDPLDPLNWPTWKRELCFWAIVFASGISGALTTMPSPALLALSIEFGISIDNMTSSFSSVLIGIGFSTLLQGSLAAKFGHRIVYLGSVLLMFLGAIGCAVSPNLMSIRASRVIQGFGAASFQSLPPSTIENLFFVHERGTRTIIWNFGMTAGFTLGPLLYGYVVQNLHWNMGFWFLAIAAGVAIFVVFFFVVETTYRNRTSVALPVKEIEDGSTSSVAVVLELQTPAPAKSYWGQLSIWNGTYTNENVFRIFFRPFPFILSPVVFYVFLVFGMQAVWMSFLPACSSTIFTLEYNFTPSEIGLTNVGSLVGIILGILTGPLTDWGVVSLAQRNKGVYEPEFRIIFDSVMLIGTSGYVGWAVGTSHNMPWIGAVACLMIVNYAILVSSGSAIVYLLDTHGRDAVHALALINFLKTAFIYGFSFIANGMVLDKGVKTVLLILGGCQTASWILSVPMYVFGKRARSFVSPSHPAVKFSLIEQNRLRDIQNCLL